MRTLLAGSLFALAILVAACGGGGKSGVVPTLGGNSGGGSQSNAKTTNAVIVLNIPAPNRQVSRRPFYVSPGTQSLGVLVVPATSTETPTPTNLTIFPVATPSPCAAASGGGYTCTLNVTAPIGTDNFFVGAFATASPNANAVPLSQYEALGITVSASSGSTPLTFTLDGVVYKVQLSVPSPDPGNTPYTEVFPAAVAAGPLPLDITAYDSSNTPILTNVTNTFATPIAIGSPSPGGDGVTLSLNGATCSTITNGAVSVGCAADLNKVQFAYDGTTTPDTNDHVIDTFTIATTTQQGNPTPSPAYVVLSSNVIPYQIPLGGDYAENAFLLTQSSGQLLYVVNIGEGGLIGTFTPSTAALSAPVTLNGVEDPSNMAVAPNGAFFVVDSESTIDCWSTASSAVSGAAPSASFSPPPDPDDYVPGVYALTVDSANNVWIVGYDYEGETYQEYATYFPAAGACSGSPVFGAYITLNGDSNDEGNFITPLSSGGMAYASGDGDGLYTATTANAGGSVNSITPALGSGSYSGGVGTGANGTVYAPFYSYETGTGDMETMPSGGSSLSSLLSLVPTSAVNGYGPEPDGLSVFSLNGVPDRISYVDNEFYALGVVGNLTTTPTTMLISLPNVYNVYQTTHNSKGGEYIIYEDSNGYMYLTRSIQTTTWNVPVTSIGTGECGETPVLSINQRAPSAGPFTLGFPDGGSAAPMPGANNDQVLSPPGSGPFPVTVTDAGGRTETYSITVTNNEGC